MVENTEVEISFAKSSDFTDDQLNSLKELINAAFLKSDVGMWKIKRESLQAEELRTLIED